MEQCPMTMNRRSFLGCTLTAGCTLSLDQLAALGQPSPKRIMTVRGWIDSDQFGVALPHEHIICDFIGADKTGNHRWNRKIVFHRMLPYLEELKKVNVTTFFDCTPIYIGRDPVLLKQLAKAANLNIVTNTGYYGGANDKFVPKQAFTMSVDDVAAQWVKEFEFGIGDSGIHPGFIKIGVDSIKNENDPLSDIDTKIVRAAAQVSQQTNLSVTCHTGGGFAGLSALRLFLEEGGKAKRFIVAHSDNHGIAINKKVADLGGWVSFDAISRRPLKQHLEIVPEMLKHRADRLLISQDNGWYSVGEPDGGQVRGYTELHRSFLPALSKAGVSKDQLEQITEVNPWNAFAI